LSIVSADIASSCDATVFNEFIGCDHSIVQIAIRGSDPPTKTHIPRWNFQRANWQHFSDLCDLSRSSISAGLEQSYQLCETGILQAATAYIFQTRYSEKSVPWWNALYCIVTYSIPKALIITGSLSALQSIDSRRWTSHVFASKIVLLSSNLAKAGREIAFMWVPGHCGAPGNESADSLARLASGYIR